jgi:SAM-dependent methyltransferase
MSDPALYESISGGYAQQRRADPRIAAQILGALGDAGTVLNVGAGTGNYEPTDRTVVALEPALAMIAQRAPMAAPVVRGLAERLPFRTGSFAAAMAVLTLHHWRDLDAGLRELRRVAPRQVIFFFDASITNQFWALDYFDEARTLPSETNAPDAERIAQVLDVREVQIAPVPKDCTDGFGAAFWARPEAYLEPAVHASMSWLAQLDPAVRQAATNRLARDLGSGTWDERYGHLRALDELDAGYRIVIAGS